MADLGFVRNESARALRVGKTSALAYVMLDAGNPFFTDVAQGIELAAESAELSLFICNSDNRAAREDTHLAHLQQQRVQGILITPVDPEAPASTRSPGTAPRGDRGPDPPGRELLLGGGRRRARRPAGRRPPGRPGAHPGRVRRRAALDRPGPRPAPGRARGLGRGRAPRRRPGRDPVRRAHRRRGPLGRRAAGRDAARSGGRPRPSAPTTWSRSACSSSRSAPGSGCPRTWRSWGTTTSSSPRPPRFR